jgi:hypothetical protein
MTPLGPARECGAADPEGSGHVWTDGPRGARGVPEGGGGRGYLLTYIKLINNNSRGCAGLPHAWMEFAPEFALFTVD